MPGGRSFGPALVDKLVGHAEPLTPLPRAHAAQVRPSEGILLWCLVTKPEVHMDLDVRVQVIGPPRAPLGCRVLATLPMVHCYQSKERFPSSRMS